MHHFKHVTGHLRKRRGRPGRSEGGALGAHVSLHWIGLRSGLSQRLVISANIFQNSLGFSGEMALMVPFVYLRELQLVQRATLFLCWGVPLGL